MTLPPFLDNYIFSKIGATFSPDFKKFSKNLELNKEDVLTYLGTYFPRSFKETYTICNNLFHNEIILQSLHTKEEINILDVGSGTGGNLSGLLLSLIENLPQKTNYNIIVIDGNNEALKILEKIILHFQIEFDLNISLNCHYVTFKSIGDLYENSKQFIEYEFEFVTSSKLINEIINEDTDSFYKFYNNFSKHLSQKGLLLMLDVTTKIGELKYMPILLNEQSNKFIKCNQDQFQTLIPTICAEKEKKCSGSCFSNNIFSISHSRKKGDKSKVVYRIIGKKEYVSEILSSITRKGGIIGWDNFDNPKYCKFACKMSQSQNAYEV